MAQLLPQLKAPQDVTALLSSLSRWRSALAVASELRKKRLAPNVFQATVLVNSLGRGRQWVRALNLLEEVEEKDLALYSSAMKACGMDAQRRLGLVY